MAANLEETMKVTIRTLKDSRFTFTVFILSCFIASQSGLIYAEEDLAVPAGKNKVSALEPAASEVAEAVSSESPEAALKDETEAPAASAINPPQVAIRMLGAEFNIQVLYDHPMDVANNDFIESIQMETLKGDFLGMTQFGPNAKEAYGEFMVNQKLAEFKEVVLVAVCPKDGVSKTTVKLELTEKPEIERAGVASSAVRPVKSAEKAAGTPEKKGKKFKIF